MANDTPSEPPHPASCKCGGAGWLRGHELDDADADTQADTMTKYPCDATPSEPPSAADHMDTCDTRLLPNQGYACTCGYDALRAQNEELLAQLEARTTRLTREQRLAMCRPGLTTADALRLWQDTYWELADRFDVMDTEVEELRAQNEALFAALRDHCLITLYTPITDEPKTSCLQCDKNWHGRTPEHHAPGCLAALAQDEQAATVRDGVNPTKPYP